MVVTLLQWAVTAVVDFENQARWEITKAYLTQFPGTPYGLVRESLLGQNSAKLKPRGLVFFAVVFQYSHGKYTFSSKSSRPLITHCRFEINSG